MPCREVIQNDLGKTILMELMFEGIVQLRKHQFPRRRKALLKGVQIVAVYDIGPSH